MQLAQLVALLAALTGSPGSPRIQHLAARAAPLLLQAAEGGDVLRLAAIVVHESTLRPNAVSRAGAVGYAQVLPRGWASKLCRDLDIHQPLGNLRCALRLIAEGERRCGSTWPSWYWSGRCGPSAYATRVNTLLTKASSLVGEPLTR